MRRKSVIRSIAGLNLGLAAVLLVLLGASFVPAQAQEDTVDLVLGGEGATSWDLPNIAPGDSGNKTVELHNAGSVSGAVTIWISEIVETDYNADGAALDDYLLFNLSCGQLTSEINLPTTIHKFPKDASDRSLVITPLNDGETVILTWEWEFEETGKPQNEAQGDSLSFTINYMLEEFLPPPPTPGPGPVWPGEIGEPLVDITEVAGPVCACRIIQLTLSPYEVNVDEPVTVGVLITNPCEEPQECEVILKINGVVEGRKEVVIKPGETKRVTFTISRHVIGTYAIEVNGFDAGTLVVKEMELFPVPPSLMPQPFNWWLILFIVLGAAAIASLITYLVYRKKQQAEGSPGN